MNLTDNPTKDKVVIVNQKEIKKKQEIIGSRKVIKGHTLYEINTVEQTIEVAEFEDAIIEYPTDKPKPKIKGLTGYGVETYKDGYKKIIIDKPKTTSKKLIKKPNCIYISALNRKNLIKKMVKRGIVKIKN